MKIDVTSVSLRERDGYPVMRSRTLLQRKLDVRLLYVDINKGTHVGSIKNRTNHLKRRTKVEKL